MDVGGLDVLDSIGGHLFHALNRETEGAKRLDEWVARKSWRHKRDKFYEDGAGKAQQMIEDRDEKLLKLLQLKRLPSEIGIKRFMSSFNQMTLIGIFVLIGVLLIAGMVAISSRSSRSATQPLRAGIIAQSKKYVETLGTKPFETLTTTQKLLVLHAYYSMIKFFPLAIFALLIFKGFGHQGCHATVSERLPNPGIISLILLVFTPFAICQDKKT